MSIIQLCYCSLENEYNPHHCPILTNRMSLLSLSNFPDACLSSSRWCKAPEPKLLPPHHGILLSLKRLSPVTLSRYYIQGQDRAGNRLLCSLRSPIWMSDLLCFEEHVAIIIILSETHWYVPIVVFMSIFCSIYPYYVHIKIDTTLFER